MSETKLFAVVENNKVINVVVGVEDEVVAANPGKYIEYTNGWDYSNGIDGGDFFPVEATPEEPVL
jgi:chorismate mutase